MVYIIYGETNTRPCRLDLAIYRFILVRDANLFAISVFDKCMATRVALLLHCYKAKCVER